MWAQTFMLLISLEAAVASQCWQGATFSEAVVSPAVESSGILRVPGVATLPQCVAACCDLPGFDLAWLFEGRCYVLSCQQREDCRPRERRGADSFLAFLRRASPQTLVLQSLVRGEPYSERWGPLSRSSEAPGDLEALKDLALFDEAPRGPSDPGVPNEEYSEGSQKERAGPKEGGDKLNQSEVEDGLENSTALTRNASDLDRDPDRDLNRTWGPTQETIRSDPPTWQSHFTPTSAATPPPPPPHATLTPGRPLVTSPGDPTVWSPASTGLNVSEVPELIIDQEQTLQSEATRTTVTCETPTVSTSSSSSSSSSSSAPTLPAAPEVPDLNRGPVAVVGPDRTLVLPISSLLLDGSRSTDDRGVSSFLWEVASAPPGLRLQGADGAVATVTSLRAGRYVFRLTVSDQQGATDSAMLTVRIQEGRSLPPVAHASGSHTLTLPNNSLVLRGSVTDGDQNHIQYLWTRDSQSPAAGDVLYGSDTQASLFLANLVEGTYLFQLRVTDARERTSTATATVEVRPEPGGGQQVELEMLVSVSQVSVAQRDTVVRQLAALLHVLDGDVQVRALQGHSHLSTVLRFSVRGPSGPLSSSRLVGVLRKQLLREKSDYLLFRALRVDSVLCLLACSGRGQCDPITKQCSCDPFWTENLIRRYLGDGKSNCEWRVLYVILSSFLLVLLILSLSWTTVCCCRRSRQTKGRRKTRYTILDNMDDQERVELRPKFSIKHRSTEHNSCLMMSESELDSDQDAVFSRARPLRAKNQARNGNAFG